jgi:hypothetical protein
VLDPIGEWGIGPEPKAPKQDEPSFHENWTHPHFTKRRSAFAIDSALIPWGLIAVARFALDEQLVNTAKHRGRALVLALVVVAKSSERLALPISGVLERRFDGSALPEVRDPLRSADIQTDIILGNYYRKVPMAWQGVRPATSCRSLPSTVSWKA